MDELMRSYLVARLWRATTRPLRELEALREDELVALVASVEDLEAGLTGWQGNVRWLASMADAGSGEPDPSLESAPAPVKFPGFDKPVDRALAIAGAVSHGFELES